MSVKIDLQNNTSGRIFSSCRTISLGPYSEVRDSCFSGPSGMDKFSHIMRCNVGHNSGIGSFSLASDADIGNYVSIASRVSIGAFNHPTDWLSVNEFQYKDLVGTWGVGYNNSVFGAKIPRPRTFIGSDVWVCDNAVVIAGSKIGVGCIIGAGAVVKGVFEPFSVIVGNPGRVAKMRFDGSIIARLLRSEWWLRRPEELPQMEFSDVRECLRALGV